MLLYELLLGLLGLLLDFESHLSGVAEGLALVLLRGRFGGARVRATVLVLNARLLHDHLRRRQYWRSAPAAGCVIRLLVLVARLSGRLPSHRAALEADFAARALVLRRALVLLVRVLFARGAASLRHVVGFAWTGL